MIIESGELPDQAAIDRATHFAITHGADFVKTSTGKTPVSATLEAAEIILEAIELCGLPVGLKASGGIRTLDDARTYLELAERIMGDGWISPDTFRFGASGVLDDARRRRRRGVTGGHSSAVPGSIPTDAVHSGAVERRAGDSSIEWDSLDAVLFDLDGVLTPTADDPRTGLEDDVRHLPRARADGGAWVPFSADDYLAYVDGKRRVDGVRSFLESRDIALPEGTTDDDPGHGTVNALGNAKNATFQQVLRTRRDRAVPGRRALARRPRRAGHGRGGGVVVAQRRGGARRGGPRRALLRRRRRQRRRRQRTCPASRRRTRSSPPPPSSACRPSRRGRRGCALGRRRRPRRWLRPRYRGRSRRRARRPLRRTAPTSSSTSSTN